MNDTTLPDPVSLPPKEARAKSLKDWFVVVVIAFGVLTAFLAAGYVVREQNQSTQALLERIEEDSQERLQQAITVNVLTISCILAIEPESRTEQLLRECIEAGFADTPLDPPPIDTIPSG